MERRGCTQTGQTRGMGEGLAAGGRGWGSAEVPGSWQGRESGRARTDRRNCTSRSGEKGERAMLGPQERGAVSDPRMAPGAQHHLPSLHIP